MEGLVQGGVAAGLADRQLLVAVLEQPASAAYGAVYPHLLYLGDAFLKLGADHAVLLEYLGNA